MGNSTPHNRTLWTIIALLVLLIYAAAPVMRSVQRYLTQALGPDMMGTYIYVALFTVLAAAFAFLYRLRPSRTLMLMLPLGVLAGLAFIVKRPEESVHYFEYALVAFLAVRALGTPRKQLAMALAFTVAVGAGDEAIQYLLPNRVGDLRDVLMNSTGGAIGVWAGRLWH